MSSLKCDCSYFLHPSVAILQFQCHYLDGMVVVRVKCNLYCRWQYALSLSSAYHFKSQRRRKERVIQRTEGPSELSKGALILTHEG